jgi:nucleotide-binding universal stress UspA family protein
LKVLIAIDGSKESMDSVSFFARLPFREKPTVCVLSVFPAYTRVGMPDDWFETLEKNAAKYLDAAKLILEPVSKELSFAVREGHSSEMIIDFAKEWDTDLIVIGSKGHNAVYRFLLGSTCEFVANQAQCSVLVVRPQPELASTGSDFRVLLAYDGSPHSKAASEQLFSLNWPQDKTQIHVAMMFPRPELLPLEVTYDAEAMSEAKQTLPRLSQGKPCECEIAYTVKETLHVSHALWELAETKNSNLLFVGAEGKSALARFFLGSTSRYLLNHVKCPVWIVKDKRWKHVS